MSTSTPTRKGKRSKGGKGNTAANAAKSPFAPSVPSAPERKIITQSAVKLSFTAGAFIDTKFWAYSRRTESGVVDKPKPLFANSAILKASSQHFQGVFTSQYKESTVAALDGPFPSDGESSTEEYDYFSDSDLDDDEDLSSPELVPSADIDVEPVEAGTSEAKASPKEKLESMEDKFQEVAVSDTLSPASGRRGRVVMMPHIAYATLHALLHYLYYDEVEFAPLRSVRNSNRHRVPAHGAPLCSPKSMYRVADLYGLNELKEKAATNIKSQLTADNILVELFSTATILYDEIQQAEVKFACQPTNRDKISSGIAPWIAQATSGVLQDRGEVITAIIRALIADSSPANASTPPKPQCGSCSRQFMNTGQQLYCDNCGRHTAF